MIPVRDARASAAAAMLLAAALGWGLAVMAAPWLAAGAPAGSLRLHSAAVVYVLGGLVCHQRADRSFRAAEVQWPVCGRCTGVYLGAAAGVLAFGALALRRRPILSLRRWPPTLALATLPTLATWVLEVFDLMSTSTPTRALLAVPLGAAVAALLADLRVPTGRYGKMG